ncbi:NTP pyrophosphatase (non-canonical NTP hydrolase) [Streptomyces sp. 3330]|uniref:MazG-like family protein n=1 Tax=Streptomyces sp. 3330 TaxID=2817755 RepID=UPI002855F120|nr:MazG-like family protein [Streptomyces sp. 3330]MDR6973518.1 NTP pyrophosphatase (non-canonical NTP hydrolase) [Streptomyces sp. 3330]
MDIQPPATGPTESAGPPALWATVDALWSWLDADAAHGGREGLLLRVLKLSEEVGEVAQAVIGATGQNPRKGVTHTWEDVQGELCDVAITALVALRTLTPETERVFAGHLAWVAQRSLGSACGGVAGGAHG